MSSAFSPLEALLLFQYLSNYGVSPTVFTRISDLLKSDQQIRTAKSFDPDRLSPDALRDFYLRLFKEEARSEVAAAEHDGTNGDGTGASRKRKAPSPSLPTIQEASQNAHLIPKLIRKLYARYREHAIIEIREEERRYTKIGQKIKDIESGQWDERLQREIDRGEWDHVLKQAPATDSKRREDTAVAPDGPIKRPVARPQERQQIPTPVQSQPVLPAQPRPPIIAPQAPRPPTYSRPSATSTPQPPAISPRQSSQTLPRQAPPPNAQHAPYAQHGPPLANASPRPADGQSPRTAQSPSMLPPPPPANYPSQQLPPYPYANNVHPPQRPPTHISYAPPQGPQSPSPQTSPTGAAYPQYGVVQSPYVHPGPPGGVMLQPFAVAPQTPTGLPRQVGPGISNIPYDSRTGIPPRSPAPPLLSSGLSPYDIAKLLATPLTTKRFSSAAIPSPSKETRWKPLTAKAAPRGQRKASPARPQSRSVSPISERAVSPPPQPTPRARHGQQPTSAPDNGPPLARSTRTRRGRGGSTTSSVPGSSVRGRTRSQSVISHAEDVSLVDNESATGRRVKNEPSTPADNSDLVRPTTEGTPGGTAISNARRSALQTNTNKRKRGTREDSEASDAITAPRQDKSVVIAVRNFPRLCATITNDIQSHKHASLFSAPVRDKDAEGYSSIIRRPQDLKSIRAAITAGNRTIQAALAGDSFASSTSSQRDAGGTVVLPASEDLVPPKAIVNSGQLEKEVMRMFANAVMFNPGDDDVVQDAREMFETVEKDVARFRDVERGNGSLAIVSEGGKRESEIEAEEEEPASGKRRRVG